VSSALGAASTETLFETLRVLRSRDVGVVFTGDGGRVGQRVRVPKTAELVAAHLRRQIVRNELHESFLPIVITTSLTDRESRIRAKEAGAFITTADGQRVALGIPGKQISERKGDDTAAYKDIPLGRPGSATEAASSILAVVSPLFSYVNGQTIEVTGGRGM